MTDTIHNIVREMRVEAGDTQEELAQAVGVSRQTIIAIERGNYVPSLTLALKIAKQYKRRIEEIFTLA
mgnify:CR=1 FL=1